MIEPSLTCPFEVERNLNCIAFHPTGRLDCLLSVNRPYDLNILPPQVPQPHVLQDLTITKNYFSNHNSLDFLMCTVRRDVKQGPHSTSSDKALKYSWKGSGYFKCLAQFA